MSDEWRWIGSDGFEYSGGLERLGAALGSGELEAGTLVWRAGLDDWKPAWELPELAAHIAPAPELRTPAPIGISADSVVVASPSGRMHALSPPARAAAEPPERPPLAKPRRTFWLRALPGAFVGVLVLGAIAVVGWYAGSRGKKDGAAGPGPALSASAPGSASAVDATAPAHQRCFTHRTKPLEKKVVSKIPIVVSASPTRDSLMVGLAATRQVARAVTIDTETLAVRDSIEERAVKPIVGVVPLAGGGEARLAVDVNDPRIRLARTIEAEKPFEIGLTKDGFSRLDADGELHTLWPGSAGEESTVPRVDGSAELGHLVTVRRGGRRGTLHAGWLGPSGARRSDLANIDVEASELGTPTAAVGGSGVLLAVAARARADAPWDVLVGTADPAKLPKTLRPLAGGGKRPRMSPAAAALAGGQWALQWTERTESGHEVRVQILDASLEPLTEPVTVSPEGSSSGQGEIWARADRIVSLFLVVTQSGHELWGSIVTCH